MHDVAVAPRRPGDHRRPVRAFFFVGPQPAYGISHAPKAVSEDNCIFDRHAGGPAESRCCMPHQLGIVPFRIGRIDPRPGNRQGMFRRASLARRSDVSSDLRDNRPFDPIQRSTRHVPMRRLPSDLWRLRQRGNAPHPPTLEQVAPGYLLWGCSPQGNLVNATRQESRRVLQGWFLQARLREACGQDRRQLSGIVEVDETHVGGKESAKHADKRYRAGRGPVSKQPVIGIRERGGGSYAQPILSNVTKSIEVHRFEPETRSTSRLKRLPKRTEGFLPVELSRPANGRDKRHRRLY